MEFTNLGKHCQFNGCNKLDFLPFSCNGCHNVYCLEHHKYADHSCSIGPVIGSIECPTCPLCSQIVSIKRNESFTPSAEQSLNDHISRGCPIESLQTKKCVQCKKSNYIISTCLKCNSCVCIKHRHSSDHNCDKLKKQVLINRTNLLATKTSSSSTSTSRSSSSSSSSIPAVSVPSVLSFSNSKNSITFQLVLKNSTNSTNSTNSCKPLTVHADKAWTVEMAINEISKKLGIKADHLCLMLNNSHEAIPENIPLDLIKEEIEGATLELIPKLNRLSVC